MMNRRLDNWLLLGLGPIAVLILGSGMLVLSNTSRLNEDAAWVAHTQEVLDLTSEVLRTLVDAETGERGFLLSGREEYLQPYDAAAKRLVGLMATLQEKTSDNPSQQDRIRRLQEMSAGRMAMLQEAIALRRKSEKEVPALIATGKGKAQMDAIRDLIAEMERAERDLLVARQSQSRRTYFVAQSSAVVTAALALMMVVAFGWLLRRSLSARQRTTEILDEQRERLRTTLASIGDAVITTDAEGRVTTMNAVAESLTGWAQKEAEGQPLDTVFCIVNEKTRKSVENPAMRALREGVIIGLANHTVLIRKDGTERPIDDSAAPIRDGQGNVVGCVLVFRDVTDRRHAEQQLANEAARIASIVNHVIDGIITIDENGTVETFNPAAERLFGYKASEVVGQNVKLLMPPPYHSEHDGYLANYRRSGQAKIIGIGREVEGCRKDGSTFPMDLAVSEFRLGDRRYFTGIVRDISERKRGPKQPSTRSTSSLPLTLKA